MAMENAHVCNCTLPLQGGDVDAELCHNTRHGCCQATRLAGVQKEGDFPFFLIPHLVSTLSRHVIDFEGVDRGDSCGEVCD